MEIIRFECGCGKRIKVAAHFAGHDGLCPACGAQFIVPNPPTSDDEYPVASELYPQEPTTDAADQVGATAMADAIAGWSEAPQSPEDAPPLPQLPDDGSPQPWHARSATIEAHSAPPQLRPQPPQDSMSESDWPTEESEYSPVTTRGAVAAPEGATTRRATLETGAAYTSLLALGVLSLAVLASVTIGHLWEMRTSSRNIIGGSSGRSIAYVGLFSMGASGWDGQSHEVKDANEPARMSLFNSRFGGKLNDAGLGSLIVCVAVVAFAVVVISTGGGTSLHRGSAGLIACIGLLILSGYALHLRALLDVVKRADTASIRAEWVIGVIGGVFVVLRGVGAFVQPILTTFGRLPNLVPGRSLRRASPVKRATVAAGFTVMGIGAVLTVCVLSADGGILPLESPHPRTAAAASGPRTSRSSGTPPPPSRTPA